ncbi:Photosystem I assembly protein Ycf3 [uncultured archaeon]|nr:Photosystem I assembly protein Ycf3 [uncultured archaeon]
MSIKVKFVLILIVLGLLCAPASGQMTAVDWDNRGIALEHEANYSEAIQAYNKAIDIDPQDELGWNLKADLLKKLGRTTEADAVYAKITELEAARAATIIDHAMASNVDESTTSVLNRTQDFSINASKAYSWLSLRNVPGASTIWWYWFSPNGDMLYQDTVQIPMPTSGDRWSTYNVSSHIDIAGSYPANLSGDWHADVYMNGDEILTEYFSISGGQTPIAPENQYPYNPYKFDESLYKNLYDQGKKNEAISKGDKLKAEGRYDEAIYFYDEAINLDPNNFENWRVWNSKGDILSQQGKYAEAIQAYDKAIELVPYNSIAYAGKGNALKALGRTNESDVAYATARELGDYSAWVPETNATGINLTSLFNIEILDHAMASNVDESTANVVTRTETFSSTDSKVYSWLSVGHVLGATVDWHWYSPDGNPYKTGQFNVPNNPSGGYWDSYNVWYGLDIADIPTEPYMSGNWHADVYINGQKRLTEQFILKIGSGASTISPNATPGSGATHGTFTVLDHAMASEIDEATGSPITSTKTNEFKDSMMPYSWLQLGNIGAARVEWDWHSGGYDVWHGGAYDIEHTYNIPANPSGGYHASYNVWDSLDIPGMLRNYETGESNEWQARREAEQEGYSSIDPTNPSPHPRGDWTVDIYVNDQWLLQEQFTVVSG